MRLGRSYQVCIAVLALVDSAYAADPSWQPISFTIDPMSPMVLWSPLWKPAFGGVTNPSRFQVGWGASQRILNTADVPPERQGDINATGFIISPFVGSELRVYGGRAPSLPNATDIFRAIVNDVASSTGVSAPGKNGSAISIDLSTNISSIHVFAAEGEGVLTIDALQYTSRIATNFTSADQIPRVTEYFITDGALNPRLTWENHTTDPSARWRVQKGVADVMEVAASPIPTATATQPLTGPVRDSGPSAYWQAVSASNDTSCRLTVPAGTSFLVINGTTGLGRGVLAAEFQPLPPLPRGRSNETPSDIASEQFNSANSSWAADTILYVRELDPTVQYNLSVRSAASEKGNIGIHSITYFYGLDTGDKPTTAAKSNTAAIAGGVVGGVVGGLLLTFVAVYLCIWRPRKRKEREEAEREANIENSRFTPFVQPQLGSEAHINTVPPSYDPAWAGAFPRETSAPRTNSESDAPLLGTASEKQLYTDHSGLSTPSPSVVPDWKRPYLPESHGGVPLGRAPSATETSGPRGFFRKRTSTTGTSEQTLTTTAGAFSEKSKQSPQDGYSEAMLRAVNPDP
ncbi:hypothetical protein CC85DRAFT_282880 [Cutaneotrichosporon oleaginosum]|uniref:Uncharacterized protein n=1 Tax=Cutaneotrichosporon oleaginosum TaxID=879819 RepID=A0A0J0XV77_9TREE|nr:uncharacterized protein CC85DRAFT_282880 [Cutaneotrichosporon oleaginosum]KLT44961.1 hypothetical protein CC85DRAFT_282880 [Cutaneotrichosporon oleaginosum]TXT09650.1 hypothetical protein COLE_03584 [Cutaneotrichosporon oleaginosum]